jgi:hypothetical protein
LADKLSKLDAPVFLAFLETFLVVVFPFSFLLSSTLQPLSLYPSYVYFLSTDKAIGSTTDSTPVRVLSLSISTFASTQPENSEQSDECPRAKFLPRARLLRSFSYLNIHKTLLKVYFIHFIFFKS